MTMSIGERRRLLLGTALICWIATTVESQEVKPQDAGRSAWPSIVPGETAVTYKIRRTLDEPTHLDFEETPLDEVLNYLKQFFGIEIQLDTKALDEVGIGSDTPVTARCRGISLRSGLHLMLESMDKALTYTIQHEVLLITTLDAEPVQRRVYNVAKLLGERESAKDLAAAMSAALERVAPSKLQITPYRNLLIVSGNQSSHDQLAQLLAALHRGIDAGETAAEEKACRALDQPTRVDFDRQPLSSVVAHLSNLHDIEIELDEESLAQFNISRNAPVTIRTGDVPLRSVLKQLLKAVDPDAVDSRLFYTSDGKQLLIKAAYRLPLKLRLYHVEPLRSPARSAAQLAKLLSNNIRSTYDDNPLTASPFRSLLLVTGTEQDHERVSDLLAETLKNDVRAAAPQR